MGDSRGRWQGQTLVVETVNFNDNSNFIGGAGTRIPSYSRDTRLTERFSRIDRKSTRLNSSHDQISYAVFCLKKKKNTQTHKVYDPNNKHIDNLHNLIIIRRCNDRINNSSTECYNKLSTTKNITGNTNKIAIF